MNLLHRLARGGSVLSLGAMIVVVALQVFARAFLQQAPPWTEEASRICFLYLIAFGIGPAVRSGKLVRLELFDTLLGPKANATLQLGIGVLTALFSSLLCLHSWRFTQSGSFERSPALGLQMDVFFASMLLLSLSLLAFTLESLVTRFSHRGRNPKAIDNAL